jgi:hypothetical protein
VHVLEDDVKEFPSGNESFVFDNIRVLHFPSVTCHRVQSILTLSFLSRSISVCMEVERTRCPELGQLRTIISPRSLFGMLLSWICLTATASPVVKLRAPG